MSETAWLVLLLDGPLQSWGSASRFERRATDLHPTKSGVIGLLCAAMGLAKGSEEERALLPSLAALRMTTIAVPRSAVRRLDDFHTTGGGYDKGTSRQFIPRRASGKPSDDATLSRRHYLLDARFGVILEGSRALHERSASALRDPVWGVWLGRKSCIPAEPLLRGIFESLGEAEKALIGDHLIEHFTRAVEVGGFDEGTDSFNDQPVSFGRPASSSEGRAYSSRRVSLIPASAPEA